MASSGPPTKANKAKGGKKGQARDPDDDLLDKKGVALQDSHSLDLATLTFQPLATHSARAPAPPRSGACSAVYTVNKQAFVFGGVADLEGKDEPSHSVLFNDLHVYDLQRHSWDLVRIKPPASSAVAAAAATSPSSAPPSASAPTSADSPAPPADGSAAPEVKVPAASRTDSTDGFGAPCPRRSAMMCVSKSRLFLLG